MKIYTTQAFLQLPAGTLFCKGRPWAFDWIEVKGETTAGIRSYWSRPLNGIDADSTEQLMDRYETMLAGTSHPLNASEGRDVPDPGDIFLVFELADLAELARIVMAAEKVIVP